MQRAAEGALQDRTLAKNIDWVNELDRELDSVDKADPAWKSTAVAGNILQDLTLQKSLAANDAGSWRASACSVSSAEIQELIKQAIKIEYETLNGQKGALDGRHRRRAGRRDQSERARTTTTSSIDDEHQQWPFNGEYWKDELGYYRFKVGQQVRSGGSLPPSKYPPGVVLGDVQASANRYVSDPRVFAILGGIVASRPASTPRRESEITATQTALTKPIQQAKDEEEAADHHAPTTSSAASGEKVKSVTDAQIKVLQRLIDDTNDTDPEKPDLLFRMAELYNEQ